MISVFRVISHRNLPATRPQPYAPSDGLAFGTVSWLRAAVDAGFEVFITNDSSLEFQQNVKRIGIAVIAIVGFRNRIQDLRPLIPKIVQILATIQSGQVITITR